MRRKYENHEQYLERRRLYHAVNRDCINVAKRDRYQATPPAVRKARSRRKNIEIYGISLKDYDALFESQGGVCAICRRHESFKNRQLMVDHDHDTKTIRGLLCGHCNLMLGHCADSPEVLSSAIDYLGRRKIDGFDSWGKEAPDV